MKIKNFKLKINSRGFTLIELLLVMVILSVLMTMGIYTGITHQMKKARDTRRIQDLQQIARALEMYYNDHGEYPSASDSDDTCVGSDAGNINFGESDTFINDLVVRGYMTQIPIETNPIPNRGIYTNCSYIYFDLNPFAIPVACNNTRFKILYTILETDNNSTAKGDERPSCLNGVAITPGSLANDYAIYLPY